MSQQMIQVLLWIPFIFVAAITLPVFCSAGYRRGTWNALVSLAATVLAAVVSVVLARALAAPVSRPIVRALEEVLSGSNNGMSLGMEAVLLHGMVCVFMAMGIYGLLMLVLTVLFKYIARALWGQELQRSDSGMRWGGLMVRLVDGVLYALLLLLPLYGSLGNVLPVLSSLAGFAGEDTQVYQTLTTVTQHPVAKASSVGPLKIVYGELAVVPTENGDISLVEVTESVTGTAQRYQQLQEAMESDEVTMEQIDELLVFAREELLQQDWVYSAYCQMLDSIPLEEIGDEASAQLLGLMRMDQKTFIRNADAILSVVQYALEEGVVERLEENPEQSIAILYDSGLMERLGDMINSSEESVALRDLLIQEAVESICQGDSRQISRLMATYHSQLHRDEISRQRDAEALLLITGASDGNAQLNRYEALLRLGFERELVRAVFMENESDDLEDYIWADREYLEEKESQLKEKYGKKLTVQELIWQDVLAASQLPLEEHPRFDRNVPDLSEAAHDWAEYPEY